MQTVGELIEQLQKLPSDTVVELSPELSFDCERGLVVNYERKNGRLVKLDALPGPKYLGIMVEIGQKIKGFQNDLRGMAWHLNDEDDKKKMGPLPQPLTWHKPED